MLINKPMFFKAHKKTSNLLRAIPLNQIYVLGEKDNFLAQLSPKMVFSQNTKFNGLDKKGRF